MSNNGKVFLLLLLPHAWLFFLWKMEVLHVVALSLFSTMRMIINSLTAHSAYGPTACEKNKPIEEAS